MGTILDPVLVVDFVDGNHSHFASAGLIPLNPSFWLVIHLDLLLIDLVRFGNAFGLLHSLGFGFDCIGSFRGLLEFQFGLSLLLLILERPFFGRLVIAFGSFFLLLHLPLRNPLDVVLDFLPLLHLLLILQLQSPFLFP